MSLYSIALFLHIVGALLLFVLLTIEGVGLRQGFMAARLNRVLGPLSALAILVPGLYMSASQWGWKGWVVVGITAWLLIAVGGAATGIGLLAGRLTTRAAAASWSIRVGIALGVVFIMTVKPDLLLAVIAVAAGAALGSAGAFASMRQVRSA
jgi:hypothetical protein